VPRTWYECIEITGDALGMELSIARGEGEPGGNETFSFPLAPSGDIPGLCGIRHDHAARGIDIVHEAGRGGEQAVLAGIFVILLVDHLKPSTRLSRTAPPRNKYRITI
jgi:hypothetical protein